MRGLATTAARRAFLMRNAEITDGGRARLDRWDAELAARAAEVGAADTTGSPVS